MADKTSIEWCDSTFNPWVGCTKVSPACDHCYAEGWAKRSGSPKLWQGERRRTKTWGDPVKWQYEAGAFSLSHDRRRRVFCASLADVFDNQVPVEWRRDLWALIAACPDLDWLLLTKRPQNIAKMLPTVEPYRLPWNAPWHQWPWPNVWLGVTAENQEEADRRIPILLSIPAVIHFASYEPMLGPVHFSYLGWPNGEGTKRTGHNALIGLRYENGSIVEHTAKLDWIISGGESGPNARIHCPAWPRAVRDQCAAAGVAYLHKQNGEWLSFNAASPCLRFDGTTHFARVDGREYMNNSIRFLTTDGSYQPDADWVVRVGKHRAGRLLDGVEHNQFPRVQ